MTPLDRDALQRALAIGKAMDRGRADQLKQKLAEEAWHEVAAFAARVCQARALRLRPWEIPPAGVEDDDDSPAGQLRRELLAAGVSAFEPNPVAALHRALPEPPR